MFESLGCWEHLGMQTGERGLARSYSEFPQGLHFCLADIAGLHSANAIRRLASIVQVLDVWQLPMVVEQSMEITLVGYRVVLLFLVGNFCDVTGMRTT